MPARIQKILVENFKRFKHLRISGLNETHRFVFLLGPNGCGKSSLFEAFNCCSAVANEVPGFDASFHIRSDSDNTSWSNLENQMQEWRQALNGIAVGFHGKGQIDWGKQEPWSRTAFTLRGSHRIAPHHSSTQLARSGDLENEKPNVSVLRASNTHVYNNYQRLALHQLRVISNPDEATDESIARESLRLLRELQKSVNRVFPDITLVGLGDPQGEGTFIFRRNGGSKFRFAVLSSGENVPPQLDIE